MWGGGCPGTGVRGRSCVIPTSVCGHVLLQDDKPEVGGLTGRRSWCGNYPVRLPSAVISDPARERAWWMLLSKPLFSCRAGGKARTQELHPSLSWVSKPRCPRVSAHPLPRFQKSYFSAERWSLGFSASHKFSWNTRNPSRRRPAFILGDDSVLGLSSDEIWPCAVSLTASWHGALSRN